MTKPYIALALAAALPSACSRAQPYDAPITPEPAREATRTQSPSFFEVVDTRRSIRAFTGEPVEQTDLTRILQAANRAPSAGNLQAYEIVVVSDRDRRQRLGHASFDQPSVSAAPLVLVFIADPARSARRYGERGERLFALQDATIAAAYAQLAVHALGLASVWVGAFDDKAVLDAVDAPAGLIPSSLLVIGHGAQAPAAQSRRDLRDLIHRERF